MAYANVTVHHKMHADRRFDLLGQLAGWSRPEACWRMVELWARCTALKTDRPPADVIRIHLGLNGEQHLVDAVLGERMPDGGVRVLGGGLTGGDTDRFGWYEPVEARNAAGGRARAAQVRREGRAPGGRFAPAGASVNQQPSIEPSSVTSNYPASTSNPPASGFRIPEDPEIPLPRAILPSTEHAPHPSPSPEAPKISDSVVADELELRRAAKAMLWREYSDLRQAIADELKLEIRPLPAIGDPGERALADRLVAAGPGGIPGVIADARHCMAVVSAEARRDRSVQWLTGMLFEGRSWQRALGMSVGDAKRQRAGPSQRHDPTKLRFMTAPDD